MAGKSINLLVAYPEVPSGMEEGMRQAFLAKGLSISKFEVRSSMSLVKQYVAINKDIDAVILAQHLKSDSFSPEELDAISVALPNATIILITDESKGSEYVSALEQKAIYNALFNDDGNIEDIVALIKKPRTKPEARIYYGVTGSDAVMGSTSERFETIPSVNYIENYGGKMDELIFRLDSISSKITASQFVDVLCDLPEEVFAMVCRIGTYKEVCRLALERKQSRIVFETPTTKEPVKAPKKAEKPKKESFVGALKKKKTVKKKGKDSDNGLVVKHKETKEIAFLSNGNGVGCTYQAILAAHSYKRNGKKVAIVEIDDSEHNFASLCTYVNKTNNISGLNSFSIDGVDYFFGMTMLEFVTQKRLKYDIAIYDFGCCSNDVIDKFILPMNRIFVVCSGNEWKYGELAEFVRDVGPLDVTDSFVYLFPCIEESDLVALKGLLPKNRVEVVGAEPNSFAPSRKTQRLFLKYLGKLEAEQKQKIKPVPFAKKISAKPSGSMLIPIILVSSVLVLGSLAGIITTRMISNREKKDLLTVATSEIASRDNEIASLSNAYEKADAQIKGYETTVLILKEPISAGTAITSNMVDEVVIHTDLDKSLYLTMDDIEGKVAATNLTAGTPIYSYYLAKPIVDVLPPEEETVPEFIPDAEGGADGDV